MAYTAPAPISIDRKAFEKEALSYSLNLKAFAHSLCQNAARADDLVQDTYVKALSNIHLFEPGTNMRAWLFTILRNSFYSDLRKRRREVEMDDGMEKHVRQHHAAPPPTTVEDMDEFAAVAPFLAQLTQEQRDVLLGIYVAELKYEEIAAALSVACGTVKSRGNRALKVLRRYIEDGEIVASYDLSSWAAASRGISPTHPYYPIAKAYEQLYALLSTSHRSTSSKPEVLSSYAERELEAAWDALVASGALGKDVVDKSLAELMREDEWKE